MALDNETSIADHFDGLDFFYTQVAKQANELPPDLHFLEIGCYLGGSAMAMMQAIRESRYPERLLITVDPYGGKPFKLGPTEELPATETKYNETTYRRAIANMSHYADEHALNHVHYKLTSDDFMKVFDQVDYWQGSRVLGKQFGVAFVDGDHNYQTVTRELLWLKEHMPTGLIILDDIPYVDRGPNGESGGEVIAEVRRNALAEDNFRVYYPVRSIDER